MSEDKNKTILRSPEILGISVSKIPSVTRYMDGETEPDLSGGELSIVYADGTTRTIPMVDDMESYIKDDRVYIKCLGKTAKFPITVVKSANAPKIEEVYVSPNTELSSPEPIVQQPEISVEVKTPVAIPTHKGGKYLDRDWVVAPFYAGTSKLRFGSDDELEEIAQ